MLGIFVFIIALGSIGFPEVKKAEPVKPVARPVGTVFSLAPVQHTPAADSARANAAADTLLPAPNITRTLAKALAAEVIKRNPTGPGPAGSQRLRLIRPTDAVDKLTSQALEKFDLSEFQPRVPDADLRITSDSPAAFQLYFIHLSDAIKTHFSGIDFAPKSDLSAMNFPLILAAYSNLIAALKQIEVPVALTPLHQKELSLVLGQQRLMKYLAAYEADPLSALLALNMQEQLAEDSATLGNSFRSFIGMQGLSL